MLQTDSYVTEVAYPHHFQHECTPVWLDFAATALGCRAPDISGAFDWCELGCGQGFSLLVNAATHPDGRFYGVDMNPQHIVHGRGLAQAAGVNNLALVEASFANLEDCREIPAQLDFIVCHGVYSWVSPGQRLAIRRFIAQRLKPGGMVYLSYASQPGTAFFAASQRFLREYVTQATGSFTQRFSAGLEALRRLASSAAGQFASSPELLVYLQQSLALDPAYLAHDWLAGHWECLHVADVMADFATLGFTYRGSATLVENIDALSLPGNVQGMLAELPTTALRETFKDLVRNQSLRRDLYQRDAVPLSENEHRQALLDQVVGLIPFKGDTGSFGSRIGPIAADPELLGPLRDALASGPHSFAQLARLPGLAGRIGDLSPALQTLAWAEQAHPLRPGRTAPERAWALNKVISERALHGQAYTHLAAPSLGSALPASLVDMAAARTLLEHPGLRGSMLRQTILALLRRIGWRHESASEASWEQELDHFEIAVLPRWLQLGVVG